jgi:hypothetical protein
MPEITKEQWEARRQRMLANGVGLTIYNPAIDRTVEMALTPEGFRKQSQSLQWEAYIKPALQQLEIL